MIKRLINSLKHSFFKFAIVGFCGMLTNLIIFFISVDILKLWPNVIAVIAFLIAGTQNYMLHHMWTFNKMTCGKKFTFFDWFKFSLTSLIGLVINIIILNLILHYYDVPYKVIAQGCGVFGGTAFNYLGSKYFVFNAKDLQKQ
ncbi:MAG: GtrA family protein [Planctomycetes bacterium]|nr:GtrA family protein [Planctomycetota bacterium]